MVYNVPQMGYGSALMVEPENAAPGPSMEQEEPQPDAPLAELLLAAMAAAGVTSKRRLAVLLAGTRDKTAVENARTTVRRLLSGEQKKVHEPTAVKLAEILGTPIDYWPIAKTGTSSNATALAEELIRRLDAGEPIPTEEVERAADAVERAGLQTLRVAEALRLRARASQTKS